MWATIISTTEVATLKLSVVNFNEPGFARTHVTPRVCAAISKRLLLETGSTGCRRRATVNPLNFSLFCRTTVLFKIISRNASTSNNKKLIIFHPVSCFNNIFLKIHITPFLLTTLKSGRLFYRAIKKMKSQSITK